MLLFNTVWAFVSLVFCVTLALVFESEFPPPVGAEGDAQDRRCAGLGYPPIGGCAVPGSRFMLIDCTLRPERSVEHLR